MTRTDYIAFLENLRDMIVRADDYHARFIQANGALNGALACEEERFDGIEKLFAKIEDKLLEAASVSFKIRADQRAGGDLEQAELMLVQDVPMPEWYRWEIEREQGHLAERVHDREEAERDPLFQHAEETQFEALKREVDADQGEMIGPIKAKAFEIANADLARRAAEKKNAKKRKG